MVHRIDLLAIARRVVKCPAKGIANERLEAPAGVPIVNLRRVVGRSACGNEIRIVTERNNSQLPVWQHGIAAWSARQYGAGWQSDSTERRTGTQRKRVISMN